MCLFSSCFLEYFYKFPNSTTVIDTVVFSISISVPHRYLHEISVSLLFGGTFLNPTTTMMDVTMFRMPSLMCISRSTDSMYSGALEIQGTLGIRCGLMYFLARGLGISGDDEVCQARQLLTIRYLGHAVSRLPHYSNDEVHRSCILFFMI